MTITPNPPTRIQTIPGIVMSQGVPAIIDAADRPSWRAFGTAEPGCSFVYRLFDRAHRLLYVGVTWNPFDRWTRHARTRSWWPEVAYVRLSQGPDILAYRTESVAIKSEDPLYNIHQKPVMVR